MIQVDIELKQSWDTLDEAISYFLDLVLELKALQRQPEPPTDLFLSIETNDTNLNEKVYNKDPSISLKSL